MLNFFIFLRINIARDVYVRRSGLGEPRRIFQEDNPTFDTARTTQFQKNTFSTLKTLFSFRMSFQSWEVKVKFINENDIEQELRHVVVPYKNFRLKSAKPERI